MSNPAWVLDTLLTSWGAPASRVYDARGGVDGSFWRRQAEAVELVRQCDLAINGLAATGARVDHFRVAVDTWYQRVFEPEWNWNQQGKGDTSLDGAHRAILQSLGSLLDATYLPDDVDDLDAIKSALQEAEALVRDEPSLPSAGRAYLLGLIHQALGYLDDTSVYGAAALRTATHTVAGALHTAADSGRIPSDRVPFWKSAAIKLGIVVFTATSVGGGELAKGEADRLLPSITQQQPANPAPLQLPAGDQPPG